MDSWNRASSSSRTWRRLFYFKEINSSGNDFAPSVSRDGKYLFYSRGGEIYWVAEDVIADLRDAAK